MQTMQPDLVIFRVPLYDDGDDIVLAQLDIFEDGTLSQQARLFTCSVAEDSYNELRIDQIVLAEATAAGSNLLISFTVGKDEGAVEQPIYELDHSEMTAIVEQLIKMYNEGDMPDQIH